MTDPLGLISNIAAARLAPPGPGAMRPAQGAPSFRDVLMEQIARVDQLQAQTDQAVSQLSEKRGAEVAQLMLAQSRADAAFDALLRVHDTLQRAYEELKQVNV